MVKEIEKDPLKKDKPTLTKGQENLVSKMVNKSLKDLFKPKKAGQI